MQNGRLVQMRQPNEIVYASYDTRIWMRARTRNDSGLRIFSLKVEGSGQVAELDVIVIGRFELFGIDCNFDFEFLLAVLF